MHKLTAALLAGFAAIKGFSVRVAVRIHAFLVALHVANLRNMVKQANKPVRQYDDLIRYHKAAAIEAEVRSDEAARVAEAVARTALIEAIAHGATL